MLTIAEWQNTVETWSKNFLLIKGYRAAGENISFGLRFKLELDHYLIV